MSYVYGTIFKAISTLGTAKEPPKRREQHGPQRDCRQLGRRAGRLLIGICGLGAVMGTQRLKGDPSRERSQFPGFQEFVTQSRGKYSTLKGDGGTVMRLDQERIPGSGEPVG